MRSSNGPFKLYVGDLGDNRKSDLKRLFSKYGEISTIYIDEIKHFAFVEFTSSTDAQRALERTCNKTLNGSKLRVEYAKSDRISSRDNRRPLSHERSPTSAMYDHLQVTANRLPSMQAFRQAYHPSYPTNTRTATSRGRSLTPPSFKRTSRLPSMQYSGSQELYYPHPSMYADPTYYRTYGDPYLMQRMPSPSRAYPNTYYFPSGIDRYSAHVSGSQRHRRSRSRSRRRTSSTHRKRSSRKRRTPSSSPPAKRGPRTPPLSKSSTHHSRKRSHSGSDTAASTSEQKSIDSSSSEDESYAEKRSNSKRKSLDDHHSNQKHLKRKAKE